VFPVKIYTIIGVPFDTPIVLYLNHHSAASDGRTSDILCDECLEEFRLILQRFVDNCTYERSCKCNVCLRQPPSLRNLASHRVFNLIFNLLEFALTGRTLYHQYIYAVDSNVVPEDKLVPLTFFPLQCTFVRDKRCEFSKISQ